MKKSRFHEKGFKYARGGRLFSSIQSGPVLARGGEGSTCPSRGELWLTVYRAHASLRIQLSWEHFFLQGLVITFGILYSLCPVYRFGEISLEGKIFS